MPDENNKSVRLLDYLEAICRLRSKVIKDIDGYQKILWLKDIPRDDKQCFCQAWGPVEDIDSDIWLQIKKYDEPVLEDVPEKCEDWVNNATLYDASIIPVLCDSIQVETEEEDPDWTPEDPEELRTRTVNRTLSLKDHPSVLKEWEEYVANKWQPWSELHKKWELVQNIYSELFSIHQEQLKRGEEYELVIGIGLLQWKTRREYFSRRHTIVAKANLEFDAKKGKFTVNPAIDGAKLSLEFDMLEPEDQPSYRSREPIEQCLVGAEDNPWNRSVADVAQKAIANLLGDGRGEYHENNLEIETPVDKEKPLINYAPALILRKRNVKGLQETIESIRKQILEGAQTPKEFLNMCEEGSGQESIESINEVESSELKLSNNQTYSDPTIYFPLRTNKEQNEIIIKIKKASGVIVQGPPGTGKTHTIANLICHLLSEGKRVLVTAKTPRALRVLRNRLPESIQPLCINLLGSGIEEQISLESCVVKMLAKQDQWREEEVEKKIRKGEKNLNELKKQKAELEYKIRTARESESVKHSIINDVYQGTAAKIALRIQKEKDIYGWFNDKIPVNSSCPFSTDDLMRLKKGLKEFTPEKKEALRLKIPKDIDGYPDLKEFCSLVQEENRLKQKTSSRDEVLKTEIGQILTRADDVPATHDIIKSILKLNAAVVSITKRPMSWIESAVYDILSDKDTPWKDLLRILNQKLNGLKELSYTFEDIKFDIPKEVDRKKLLGDAKQLYDYLKSGGKLGRGIFASKVVRATRYIQKNIKINSQYCQNIDLLSKLIEFLELQEAVQYCWFLWGGKAERTKGPLFLQIGELEELREALESVVSLCVYLDSVKETVSEIEGLSEVPWHHKESINNLLNVCEVFVSTYDLEKKQEDIESYVFKGDAFINNTVSVHPYVNDMIRAISDRDVNKYSLVLVKIKQFMEEVRGFEKINGILNSLSNVASLFAKRLISNHDDNELERNIYQFVGAWNWSRARSWLDEIMSKDNIESHEIRVKLLEDDINGQIAELASLKAWRFCIKRLRSNNSYRSHMMAWQQEIRRIGRGTGRHAPVYRRNARKHLDQCRDAVPAWVMPLHRVYETIIPAPKMFDVVIVDEASQCGPEGLPLTFMADKLIVVGDEHQISPDAVGTNQDHVHLLMDEYLYGFEHADSFAPDRSLFDHASRRFTNRVVLREHFRCMPEIIRFSNDQCYRATPLIPLRQYPPDRLEPLMTVHVPDGYREGVSSNAINKPEAEVVVDKVIQCCNSEAYEEKTMGVIVLQGKAQAALIENLLLEQIGADEMERRRIICGDPYSFQGDERHVIFLSMVADSNVRNVFNKPSDLRRFNVAASRAQDQMWLIHTATLEDLSKHCLRRILLEYFMDPKSQIMRSLGEEAEELRRSAHSANRSIERPSAPFDSWFEVDVALRIAGKGYRVIPQYPVAGKRIDLVVQGSKSMLAVECDGDCHHGIDEYESDMERQRMLERCGWQFVRIKEYAFNANPETALDKLWTELDRLSIRPIDYEINQSEEIEVDKISDKQNDVETSEKSKDLFSGYETFSTEGQKMIPLKESEKIYDLDSVQDALKLKSSDIRELIIRALKSRPNFSCVKDALPGIILKNINVVSRGNPRREFTRKVYQSIKHLERDGTVEIYKSKNVRVRLVK